jgi:alpha-mannosidase
MSEKKPSQNELLTPSTGARAELPPAERLAPIYPRSPFPQLVPARVRAALARLKAMIWPDLKRVDVTATAPRADHLSLGQARKLARANVEPGSAWGRLFDQRWCHVPLPRAAADRPLYLHWRDQGEATLHIQGEAHYGFDVAHRTCALPAGTTEAWVESYCCQSAIWHLEATGLSAAGSVFDGAYVSTRDDEAWHAVHDLQCLYDLAAYLHVDETGNGVTSGAYMPPLERVSPLYRQLLRALDCAIDTFETAGLAALRAELASIYRDMPHPGARVKARLVGHSHLDLVYLWPERIGEAKAVHTLSTVNRLMDIYPEFRFSYSQPASYEAVERLAPSLAKSIQGRIKSGRWEPTGAMYVESDTMLPCGEALARSFMMGQEAFEKLRGTPTRLLWLPDAFGFSACVPQIMRLCGVDYFFTTKLAWNTINAFPYSSFVWRGNDGSEVVAHSPRASGYANAVEVGPLHDSADSHTQADVHREFLHPVGYGDGGGGPNEEMCERALRFANLAGVPPVEWDQPEAFFDRLAAVKPELPVWQGECYVEFHRGTATTHGHVKGIYRALERTLQLREAVAVATGTMPDVTHAWKRLIFAQFHDYVTGTSVPEVYAEGVGELESILAAQGAAARAGLTATPGGADDVICAFNPLPMPWRGWIEASTSQPARYVELAPLQGASLSQEPSVLMPEPATVRGSVMSNGIVRAVIGRDGGIESLEIDGQEIELAGSAGIPVVYPDFPAKYDAWDIDRHTLALGQPLEAPHRIEVEEAQGARAVVAVHHRVENASELVVRFILEGGACVLRVDVDVNWRESQRLLKLPFRTSYRGQMARFGAAFGSVLRPQQPGPTFNEARWETPGSRWAAVSHDGERDGLFIAAEAKYGFSCRDGELSVSLLRSPLQTGFQSHGPATPRALSRHVAESRFSDQGRHHICLAVGRYDAGAACERQPAALAESLFTSPMMYRGKPIGFLAASVEKASTLVPTWAMPLGGGRYVLRLHEVSGQAGRGVVRIPAGFTAQSVDMRQRARGGKMHSGDRLKYRPYEIVSLLVEPIQG